MSDQRIALLMLVDKGYRVDKKGVIHSPTNGIIKGCVNTTGYLYVTLRMDGFYGRRKCCKVPVHRIVAYQKYGDGLFEEAMEVRHLDNNKLNNSHGNVVIGTHSQNFYDLPEGHRKHMNDLAAQRTRKFTEDDIRLIRELHNAGISYKQIRGIYPVAKSTLSYIINKRTYVGVRSMDDRL